MATTSVDFGIEAVIMMSELKSAGVIVGDPIVTFDKDGNVLSSDGSPSVVVKSFSDLKELYLLPDNQKAIGVYKEGNIKKFFDDTAAAKIAIGIDVDIHDLVRVEDPEILRCLWGLYNLDSKSLLSNDIDIADYPTGRFLPNGQSVPDGGIGGANEFDTAKEVLDYFTTFNRRKVTGDFWEDHEKMINKFVEVRSAVYLRNNEI